MNEKPDQQEEAGNIAMELHPSGHERKTR